MIGFVQGVGNRICGKRVEVNQITIMAFHVGMLCVVWKGWNKLFHYLLLFGGQGLNFIIAVVNIRAASRGKYLVTGGTDFLFCLVSFILIQKVAIAHDFFDLLAYALGGALGSMFAIRLTKHWDKVG